MDDINCLSCGLSNHPLRPNCLNCGANLNGKTIMKPSDILSQPGAWTQHAMARGKDNNPVDFYSEKAVCWCTFGAMQKAYLNNTAKLERVWRNFVKHTKIALIFAWNDAPERTQEEVVAALRAIGE